MLQFKEYSNEAIEDLGLVSAIIGEKGSIRFSSDKNLSSKKRVTVILQLENGQSAAIPCSSKVSDICRIALVDHSEVEVLRVISSLHVLETTKDRNGKLYDEPRHFISPPGSGDGTPLKESFTLADLEEAKLTWDELIEL